MARFSVTVVDSIAALFSDATAGINARCRAINVAQSDGYALPVVWQERKTQQLGVQLQFPFYEIYTRGIRTVMPPVTVGTNLFEVECSVICWLSSLTTSMDPVGSAEQYRRLEWALLEMVIERDRGMGGRWSGRTLLDTVQNLEDERVIPVKRFGTNTMEDMGGIGAELTFMVTVAELDTA
jgi:hypothetical protein